MAPPLSFDPVQQAELSSVPLEPGTNPARIISGTPSASELVLHEDPNIEIGVWEITPGSFHSSKHGVSEFMHFLSGAGTITRASGEVIEIKPDTFVSLPDGSEVVWDVSETSRKIYIITQTQA